MEQQTIRQLEDDLEPLFAEVEESIYQLLRRMERDASRADFMSGHYEQLESKLINYIAKYVAAGYLHQQFYVYYEVKLARWRGEKEGHICSLAERALELTKQIDVIPDCKTKRYSYVELELLLTLIECGHEQWKDIEKNEICLLKIIQYARLYFDDGRRVDIEDRAWRQLLKDVEIPAGR